MIGCEPRGSRADAASQPDGDTGPGSVGRSAGREASTGSDPGVVSEHSTPSGLIVNETGAQRLLGYTLDVGQGDGCARCLLEVNESHGNRQARFHGGLSAVMLDNAMGATASLTVDPSGRQPFVTISLNTQFLAPAHMGSRLVATGRKTGGGRSLVFVEGQIVDEHGTLIATASGVFKRARTAVSGEAG